MSLIFHLLFLCTIFISSSCSNGSQYDFESSEEALREYNSFFHTLQEKSSVNSEQLAAYINRWQELSDTVFHYIEKDPAFTAHAGLSMIFAENTDSIRVALLRLADKCTLSDVAYVKLHTSKYAAENELDSLKQAASNFYSSLDKNPIYYKDVREILTGYTRFLSQVKTEGIHSKKEFLNYIANEDRHFRSFLANLDKCSSMNMTDITNHTTDICTRIYSNVSKETISADEALVYMSMRTNRRLILNAKVCHEVLKRGKIKDAPQANAYLWMMLQPYLTMDSFGVAMLTPEQSQVITDIAKDFQTIVSRLDSKHLLDKEMSDKLPTQLMRLYISTL
ncbi:MAG: hypothetical protein ACI4TU_08485 [Candidatus Cryptobacteroides sp.]